MQAIRTAISGLLILQPRIFEDSRGFFLESFNEAVFRRETDLNVSFVQDNHSRSSHGVLRGLHYQLRRPQGKLVRVVRGTVFDVAVDLRRGSPTFGCWSGQELSESNRLQMWIPVGFAHGFLVTSESADVLYKTTDYYAPEFERCLLWNDPAIGITWPLVGHPLMSAKDQLGSTLQQAELF